MQWFGFGLRLLLRYRQSRYDGCFHPSSPPSPSSGDCPPSLEDSSFFWRRLLNGSLSWMPSDPKVLPKIIFHLGGSGCAFRCISSFCRRFFPLLLLLIPLLHFLNVLHFLLCLLSLPQVEAACEGRAASRATDQRRGRSGRRDGGGRGVARVKLGGDGGVGLEWQERGGELHPALSLFLFLGRGDVFTFVFPYGVAGARL